MLICYCTLAGTGVCRTCSVYLNYYKDYYWDYYPYHWKYPDDWNDKNQTAKNVQIPKKSIQKRTIEEFDGNGKLIKRTVETIEDE